MTKTEAYEAQRLAAYLTAFEGIVTLLPLTQSAPRPPAGSGSVLRPRTRRSR